MEVAAVATTAALEKWPMRPAPIAESSVKFPSNLMGQGLFTAKNATESIGLLGRQGDIRTIWLCQSIWFSGIEVEYMKAGLKSNPAFFYFPCCI